MIVELLRCIFFFSVFVIAIYLVRHYVFTIAVLRMTKNPKPQLNWCSKAKYEPTVSILIPARNEGQVIGRLLRRMTELTYPKDKLQVLVINDASSDSTGSISEKYSKTTSFIKVLHRSKEIGGKGKAAALNDALKRVNGEIVLCFDADYVPQKNIVEKLVGFFADPKVGAVQGRPVVLNEPKNLLTRLVALERVGGYRIDQEARDKLGLIPQFGGTVGGFSRSVIEQLGGFDEEMLTEDTDLTFSIRLLGYEVRYAGEAECYEEAVETWRAYWRQRHRWARGHMQVCFKHGLSVLRSRKLSKREKIDGLLLLHVYFLPLVTLVSFIVSITLVLSGSANVIETLWFFVPLACYSFVGNFAPFFEIGVGAYLDNRNRSQWLAPLMVLVFLINLPISAKAFLDVIWAKILGRRQTNWAKTSHLGTGNSFFPNPSVRLERTQ